MIETVTIRITNFDNAAMAVDPPEAVMTILKDVIAKIEQNGCLEELDGMALMDSNGNRVGRVSVSTIDEDELDDEDDLDDEFDDE